MSVQAALVGAKMVTLLLVMAIALPPQLVEASFCDFDTGTTEEALEAYRAATMDDKRLVSVYDEVEKYFLQKRIQLSDDPNNATLTILQETRYLYPENYRKSQAVYLHDIINSLHQTLEQREAQPNEPCSYNYLVLLKKLKGSLVGCRRGQKITELARYVLKLGMDRCRPHLEASLESALDRHLRSFTPVEGLTSDELSGWISGDGKDVDLKEVVRSVSKKFGYKSLKFAKKSTILGLTYAIDYNVEEVGAILSRLKLLCHGFRTTDSLGFFILAAHTLYGQTEANNEVENILNIPEKILSGHPRLFKDLKHWYATCEKVQAMPDGDLRDLVEKLASDQATRKKAKSRAH